MDPRRLLLTLRLDIAAAGRRALSGGVWRLLAVAAGAFLLVAAEVWVTRRLTARLAAVPPLLIPLARAALDRLAGFVLRLAVAVAAASSVTTALGVIEALESDPYEGALPRPAAERGLMGWWRTLAGLAWVAVLAGPPLAVIGHASGAAAPAMATLAAGLGLAAAAGLIAALGLAALVPRRILVPAAWTTATAAVVGAVLWLRALHPERIARQTDPAAILAALSALGQTGAPGSTVITVLGTPAGALATLTAAAGASALAWTLLGRRAGERLSRGQGATHRPSRVWAAVDAVLTRWPAGALAAAGLRHLVRNTLQGSQMLYLIGLGVVFVQNLRSLPLSDPLAVQLAGLLDLFMAGMLAAALALRFAWPARLLGGPAWWWRTAPLTRLQEEAALLVSALPPILLLAWGLDLAAGTVIGPTAIPGWIVPFLAIWLATAGVVLGPDPADGTTNWIDAALGGGGLAFLAAAVLAVGWCTAAAGAGLIRNIAGELGSSWVPPLPLRSPALVATTLSLALVPATLLRHRTPRDG